MNDFTSDDLHEVNVVSKDQQFVGIAPSEATIDNKAAKACNITTPEY